MGGESDDDSDTGDSFVMLASGIHLQSGSAPSSGGASGESEGGQVPDSSSRGAGSPVLDQAVSTEESGGRGDSTPSVDAEDAAEAVESMVTTLTEKTSADLSGATPCSPAAAAGDAEGALAQSDVRASSIGQPQMRVECDGDTCRLVPETEGAEEAGGEDDDEGAEEEEEDAVMRVLHWRRPGMNAALLAIAVFTYSLTHWKSAVGGPPLSLPSLVCLLLVFRVTIGAFVTGLILAGQAAGWVSRSTNAIDLIPAFGSLPSLSAEQVLRSPALASFTSRVFVPGYNAIAKATTCRDAMHTARVAAVATAVYLTCRLFATGTLIFFSFVAAISYYPLEPLLRPYVSHAKTELLARAQPLWEKHGQPLLQRVRIGHRKIQ